MRDRISGKEIDDSSWHKSGSRYCHPDKGYSWDHINKNKIFENQKDEENSGYSIMDEDFMEYIIDPGDDSHLKHKISQGVHRGDLLSFYFFLFFFIFSLFLKK